MKRAITIFAAALLCCLAAPAWADSSIAHIEVIPLHPGVNQVENLMPGHNGTIIQSWRGGGNALGYNLFLTMLDNKVVGISSHQHFLDVMRDEPRDRANSVMSVRFARGKMDGQTVFLLITATRNFESWQSSGDPATVFYDIYQLVSNGEAGTTGVYFAPVSESQSEGKYCNSDLALTKKFGFPLPDPYEGLNQDDGC